MKVDISDDPRFSDIGPLPSACKPYDFKHLMIRPLSVEELKHISQAISLNDITHLIRAVDLVIDQPVEVITIGDFFYILMWLRVKSYPKSPVVVNWTCHADYFATKETRVAFKADTSSTESETSTESNIKATKEVFVPYKGPQSKIPELVKSGKLKPMKCDYQNTEIVRLSKIEILCIPDDFVLDDDRLDYPRVNILPELIELESNNEYGYILPAAQWVKQGANLREKLAVLEQQPDLDLFDSAFKVSDEIAHGVKENVRLNCANCGTVYTHTLELNPLTFFRR